MKENRLIGGKELSANTLAEIERERLRKLKYNGKNIGKLTKGGNNLKKCKEKCSRERESEQLVHDGRINAHTE